MYFINFYSYNFFNYLMKHKLLFWKHNFWLWWKKICTMSHNIKSLLFPSQFKQQEYNTTKTDLEKSVKKTLTLWFTLVTYWNERSTVLSLQAVHTCIDMIIEILFTVYPTPHDHEAVTSRGAAVPLALHLGNKNQKCGSRWIYFENHHTRVKEKKIEGGLIKATVLTIFFFFYVYNQLL